MSSSFSLIGSVVGNWKMYVTLLFSHLHSDGIRANVLTVCTMLISGTYYVLLFVYFHCLNVGVIYVTCFAYFCICMFCTTSTFEMSLYAYLVLL